MSLQSQREALDRTFGSTTEIEIVEVFEESKSAKTPGRPGFATMLARIEAGEADGIMSWAPDRLARNSIDGGRIIYLLDTGALRDLKFATYTFENNSQGKFMLSIMFGQSKYYSDALSENVKRGNRTKLENGWRPNRAPLGYINDAATRTILPHPQHFALVRRIFEMVLYEGRTPWQVVRIARDDWGFLTPKTRRSGGKPIADSTIYKMLANPFYKGIVAWNGATYPGRHAPVVTAKEFDRVQAVIGTRSTPHPSRISFPFTGLIRCDACGKMITAERKRNRFGSHYTYYHCTARSLSRGNCREPSIEERELTAQMLDFLSRIAVSEQVAAWVRDELSLKSSAQAAGKASAAQTRKAAISEIDAQLAELTSLRIRCLLSDEEFAENRKHLIARRSALEQAAQAPDPHTLIEPFDLLVSASNKAVEWFMAASDDEKRSIIEITGSNPSLGDGKLSIQAAEPFFLRDDCAEFPRLRGVVDGVRENGVTSVTAAQGRRMIQSLRATLSTPEGRTWFDRLKHLVERSAASEPQAVLKAVSRTPGREQQLQVPRRGSDAFRSRARKRR